MKLLSCLLTPLAATVASCLTLPTMTASFPELSSNTASARSLPKYPIRVGYYPLWNESLATNVDFSQYTHINLAFAIPRIVEPGVESFLDLHEPPVSQLVSLIHSKGARAILAIGGWTGSANISAILNDREKAIGLAKDIINLIKKHNLDGVDLDWEFPGQPTGCNGYDAKNDFPNLLTFLTYLREQLELEFDPGMKLITMAVPAKPFEIPEGGTQPYMAKLSKLVDFAQIMTYDMSGTWDSTTGANAPFSAKPGQPPAVSYTGAITAWNFAGFPANQLVAGLAFYGRSTRALVDMTLQPTNQFQPQSKESILGDSDDAFAKDDCTGQTGASGIWRFKNLITQGVLSNDAATAKAPWVRQWDEQTQTPWLFNKETKAFLSYDDPESVAAKVKYAKKEGLRGYMVWSLGMDYEDMLTKAAKAAWP